MTSYSYKDINPLWSLVDPLTVDQAAALIAGFDPYSIDKSGDFFQDGETGLTDSDGIAWVWTAHAALANAINARKLKATVRRSAWERGWDEEPADDERLTNQVTIRPEDEAEAWNVEPHRLRVRGIVYRVHPDWGLTTVAVDDVRAWLMSRGFREGFFFPDATDAPDYLNPSDPRYAPKLAAAVSAWQANPNPKGRSVKDALKKYVREHAAEFRLTDEEGKPNETGIEEVAKVANWQDKGGAPRT
ncbi:hypothetical protein AWB68_01692 [Caballeronia choica]|uniref:Uncharacterized protein n=1 Tax=Caballeronia choica TaxID=326476 RepID=A0A158H2W9_9BURK|nr:hypothetical protein [Caballeronia choica]SAL38682.1 hypothetical protein AWB68_01692 [Caballeronia choica]